ncbi:hypothetical protein PIROE2DRAFT_17163, partial [Piromyces sp. E2]
RNISQCELSFNENYDLFSKIEKGREEVCPNIKSSVSYRMYTEGIKILPGCEDLYNYDYYSKSLTKLGVIYLPFIDYTCTKNENGNYCPTAPDIDSTDLKDICKSKICREVAINFYNAIYEYKDVTQLISNNGYNETDFQELNDFIKILNSEECINGTIEIKEENINEKESNNNNKEENVIKKESNNNNNSSFKYIIYGSIGTIAMGLDVGTIFFIMKKKKQNKFEKLSKKEIQKELSDISEYSNNNNNNDNPVNNLNNNNNNTVSPNVNVPSNVQVIYTQQGQYGIVNSSVSETVPQIYILQPSLSNVNSVPFSYQDASLPTYNQVMEESNSLIINASPIGHDSSSTTEFENNSNIINVDVIDSTNTMIKK